MFCFYLASFIDIIHRANLEPEKKYREPQTTSQEIGWFHEPLVRLNDSSLFLCSICTFNSFLFSSS